jgi:hypothetical protein
MTAEPGGAEAPGALRALLLGFGAIVLAMAIGLEPALVDTLVRPPAIVRAALVGLSVVVGLWVLSRAVSQIDASRRPGASPDLSTMVRGVRLAFIAVAIFAAGAGWGLAHPLPIVIALIIAGVDVIETSFLLLVVRLGDRRREGAD